MECTSNTEYGVIANLARWVPGAALGAAADMARRLGALLHLVLT